MSYKDKCPVCGMDANVSFSEEFYLDGVICSRCGRFLIIEEADDYIKRKKINRSDFNACLYYYLTHYRKNKNLYVVLDEKIDISKKYNTTTVDEIMNLYPKTISERIDMILKNFVEMSIKVGDYIQVYSELEFLPITFSEIPTESEYIFLVMNDMQLISKPAQWGWDTPLRFKIQYKGWQRIDELQKQFTTKNQGFIAMWFDPSMNKVEAAIKEAITESGYIPMIISDKEHNNQIVPEILYEIKNSDFVVADFTDNRGGVYYEAGYAFGQGKEVIVTVNEEKDSPHFDVAQKNQVRYKTPEELKEKLIKRIRATVGDKSKEMHR